MNLPHLNCTTEKLREEICREYEVHADDCIILYGDRVIRSDANNRKIRDKYYQFSCKHRISGEERMIICGSGAARHLCLLIGEQMPHAMNPFAGNGGGVDIGGTDNQLFITYYQEKLTPGTKIFRLLQGVADEKYIYLQPQKFQYEQFIDVVTKFHTDIPTIIAELGKYGALRRFNFGILADEVDELLPERDNIFR